MSLAAWRRNEGADVPNAALITDDGRYRLVQPICQEEGEHDHIWQTSVGPATRPQPGQTILADATAESRQRARHRATVWLECPQGPRNQGEMERLAGP